MAICILRSLFSFASDANHLTRVVFCAVLTRRCLSVGCDYRCFAVFLALLWWRGTGQVALPEWQRSSRCPTLSATFMFLI